MSPDQPTSPDAEREGERPDDHREAERTHREPESGRAEAGREDARQQAERKQGAGGEGERGFQEDLKEFPGEMREESRRIYREADDALSEKMDRQPAFERALDLRIVLASVVIALVLALILRLLGVSRPVGVIIFFIALAGVWIGLARFYSARRPRSRPDTGRESQ
jgi:hypothetical protein